MDRHITVTRPTSARQHCSGCNGTGAMRINFTPPGGSSYFGSSYFALCDLCAAWLAKEIIR